MYRQCVLLYFSTYSQYTKFQPKTPQPCSVNLYVKKKCENAKIRSCKSVNSYLDINYCRNYLNIVHFLLLLYIVLQLIKITSLIVFVCYFSGNSYPSYISRKTPKMPIIFFISYTYYKEKSAKNPNNL